MTIRTYACDVLNRVVYEGGYASILMRHMPASFSPEDRALISELVYGSLRNWTFLQYQWQDLVSNKVRRNTAVLLNMTVYQLQFMDKIPSYAAISEAVNIAAKRDRAFVNAVLRKADQRGMRMPEGTWPEKEAIQYSHPEFLLRMWDKQYGRDTAMKILEHDQARPIIYGRLNTLKADDAFYDQPGITHLEDQCFRYDGNLAQSPWLKNGVILIQSRTSQKTASMLDARPGMRVLDVCAAPGTKTQQIACAMKNQGEIIAGDIYSERVNLIHQLMERTGVTIVKAIVRDGTRPDPAELSAFDRILCDVPCSGLGDLSHKPEIRLHVTPESLDELTAVQKELLEQSSRCLKPGGILVYSTCTLNRKENEKQVEQFLARHPEFELIEAMTMFPFEQQSDGFYAAKLKRSEGL